MINGRCLCHNSKIGKDASVQMFYCTINITVSMPMFPFGRWLKALRYSYSTCIKLFSRFNGLAKLYSLKKLPDVFRRLEYPSHTKHPFLYVSVPDIKMLFLMNWPLTTGSWLHGLENGQIFSKARPVSGFAGQNYIYHQTGQPLVFPWPFVQAAGWNCLLMNTGRVSPAEAAYRTEAGIIWYILSPVRCSQSGGFHPCHNK